MSEDQNQLAIQLDFSRAIGVYAARFEKNRIVFDRSLTIDESRSVLALTVQAADASNWWAGDILAHISESHRDAAIAAGETEEDATSRCEDAAREAAKNFSDPLAAWDAMRTCQALSKRFENVSYKTHRSALAECRGDAVQASQWLAEASKYNWPPEVLRVQIRRANAVANGNTPEGRPAVTINSVLRKLYDVTRTVVDNRPISDWSLAECNAFMSETEPLLEIAEDVKERWSFFNPELGV
jgi:hypothetical protein